MTQVYGDRLTLRFIKDSGGDGPIRVSKMPGQAGQTIVRENVAEMLTRANGSGNLWWEITTKAIWQLVWHWDDLSSTGPAIESRHPCYSMGVNGYLHGIPLVFTRGNDVGELGDIVLHSDDGDVFLESRR